MALTLDEAEKMIDAAEKAGITLRVYENFVYYPPYVKAKELIEKGQIGRPLSLNMKVRCGRPEGGWEVSKDAWEWRYNKEKSGGCPLMFDHGYHNYSLVLYLMGKVDWAWSWSARTEIKENNEEFVHQKQYIKSPAVVMWKYKKDDTYGVLDVLTTPDVQVKTKHYGDEGRLEIVGEKGIIFVNRCTGYLQKKAAVELYADGITRSFEHIAADWEVSFVEATRGLINALESCEEARLTGKKGTDVLSFTLAVQEAIENRGRLLLNKPGRMVWYGDRGLAGAMESILRGKESPATALEAAEPAIRADLDELFDL